MPSHSRDRIYIATNLGCQCVRLLTLIDLGKADMTKTSRNILERIGVNSRASSRANLLTVFTYFVRIKNICNRDAPTQFSTIPIVEWSVSCNKPHSFPSWLAGVLT